MQTPSSKSAVAFMETFGEENLNSDDHVEPFEEEVDRLDVGA